MNLSLFKYITLRVPVHLKECSLLKVSLYNSNIKVRKIYFFSIFLLSVNIIKSILVIKLSKCRFSPEYIFIRFRHVYKYYRAPNIFRLMQMRNLYVELSREIIKFKFSQNTEIKRKQNLHLCRERGSSLVSQQESKYDMSRFYPFVYT